MKKGWAFEVLVSFLGGISLGSPVENPTGNWLSFLLRFTSFSDQEPGILSFLGFSNTALDVIGLLFFCLFFEEVHFLIPLPADASFTQASSSTPPAPASQVSECHQLYFPSTSHILPYISICQLMLLSHKRRQKPYLVIFFF